jgi:ABC-type sugar transport system ATPase subunit
MNNTLLRMTGIDKSFPGVHALVDVDFDLGAGEVHALLGENGAGKSTLIKILGGIYPADAGEITISGEKVRMRSVRDAQRAGVSIIHQELFMVQELTVAQNVFLGREPMMRQLPIVVDGKRILREAQAIIDSIGLDLDAGARIGDLGIAQQQMVEIAKAVSFDTRILVMDEPTSSLTSSETEKLYELIERLRDRMSVIYISHRMEELFRISDRVTVLRDGRKIGTRETRATKKDELIEMMVGRRLQELFTKSPSRLGETVLEVKKLSRKGVLEDVSFSVRAGEILGVSGIVGAGRTELMRAICGIDSIDSGEVLFRGKSVVIRSPADAIALGIAMVPESRKEHGLITVSSVGYNITLQCLDSFTKGLRMNLREERGIIAKFVRDLSIKAPSYDAPVDKLSGGNQQKVVIAKWLATHPVILILDEPTRGIDVGAKAEIYAIMDRLAHQGVAIIMISSELSEIMNMSDRVMVMHRGRVSAQLDRAELTQETIMRYATGDVK